jgi:hypothetical protein
VRDWEAAGEIGVVKCVEVPNIAKAVEKFLVDAKAQHSLAVLSSGLI